MTITITAKEAIYLYGILEGALMQVDQVEDELHNPTQTKNALASIMEKIVDEFDKIDKKNQQ